MKKLYKSRTDKMICGVCGGVGAYFGIDSTLVRLLLAGVTLFGGAGIPIYLIAAFIIPQEPLY